MKNYIKPFFTFHFILIIVTTHSQVSPLFVPEPQTKNSPRRLNRCATMQMLEEAIRKDPTLPEKWKAEGEKQYQLYLLRQQQTSHNNQRSQGTTATQTTPIVIPVVFHIVDNATSQSWITDRDIYEQIEILNRDYSGKKVDEYLKVIPSQVVARVGNIAIKFVLARRDPNGNLTTGIERRVNTTPSHVNIKSNATGGLDAWDVNKYLNVWCGTFSGSDAGLLGVATFPFTTDEGSQGVVIGTATLPYTSNTTRNYYPDYAEGSTLSHEVGHYFYLWHTFGDQSSCNNNDFQLQAGWPLPLGDGPEGDDSPMQKGSSSDNFIYGNPSMSYNDGCSSETFGTMYGCFMNYFDDRAMFMFSNGMRKRVEDCINLYRPGLLTTDGATPPIAITDAFLVSVSPRGLPERKNVVVNNTPLQAIIRNSGTSTLNAVTLNVSMDGGSPYAIAFPLTLAAGDDTTLNLNTMTAAAGNHTLTIYVTAPNGGTDDFLNNDTLQSFINIQSGLATLPFSENFTAAIFPPQGWQLLNPNTGASNTWARNAVGSTTAGSAFFKNSTINQVGSLDDLVTPALDLAGATNVLLTFKVAYAAYDAIDVSSWDGLEIYVSGDGGKTYTLIYKKTGNDLATVSPTTTSFTPVLQSQWRNESMDLSPYIVAGQKMIIKFRNTNANGNNLYMDDISVAAPPVVYNRDLAVVSIDKPNLVECNTNLSVQATVKNKGSEAITTFNISYKLDNGAAQTTIITGINLASGATMPIALTPAFSTATGSHSLIVYTSNPVTISGTGDQFSNNDTLLKSLAIPGSVNAPLVEGFESSFPPANWAIANPDANITWDKANVGRNSSSSAYVQNFAYSYIGSTDDLYSPIINYTAADSVILSFDLAAAMGTLGLNVTDTLEVLVTKDCGATFTSVYKKWGTDLQTINVPQSLGFIPANDQWRKETIDLTTNFTPSGPIQIVFRNTTGLGNNVYIDNVNLIAKTLPAKLKEQGYLIFPNPFTSQFNIWHLRQPTDLRYIAIYNSIGQMVWKQEYNGNASKVITPDLSTLSTGIYIVNLGYTNKSKNVRVKVIRL